MSHAPSSLFPCQMSTEIIPVPIHRMRLSVLCRNRPRPQKMRLLGKREGPRGTEEDLNHKLKMCGKAHVEEHGMVRRVDPHGEALLWCRKCSGYARCRLWPMLMNRCRPSKKDTKEHGQMSCRLLKQEQGQVPDTNARG